MLKGKYGKMSMECGNNELSTLLSSKVIPIAACVFILSKLIDLYKQKMEMNHELDMMELNLLINHDIEEREEVDNA